MSGMQTGSIDRRTLLAGSLALGASACATRPIAPAARIADDATALAAAIRAGRVTASDAVAAAITRAGQAQPRLNFLISEGFDAARALAAKGAPEGPFGGVPFLIKDLNNVIGLPTRNGSRMRSSAPPETRQDSYVDALVATGLVVIGKSSTPEYGFSPTTEPLATGPTRNPWNPNLSAGGSSGGAAAAVAAGVVHVAHANDGGGSIRIPAACCGVFGLKPSRGRMQRDGAGSSAIDFAVQHCITRSVRDSAALLAATEAKTLPAGLSRIGMVSERLSRPLRVGVVRLSDQGREPAPEVDAALADAAALMRSLGHKVEAAQMPLTDSFIDDFLVFWSSIAMRIASRAPDPNLLEPLTLGLTDLARRTGADGLKTVTARLVAEGDAFNRWLGDFDVVMSPVTRTLPPPVGMLAPDVPFDTLTGRFKDFLGYTPIHNISGASAMSVPLAWSDAGVPIGIQFATPPGGERLLLELAYTLEDARPWAARRPPLWFG